MQQPAAGFLRLPGLAGLDLLSCLDDDPSPRSRFGARLGRGFQQPQQKPIALLFVASLLAHGREDSMPRPRLPGMESASRSTLERYPKHVQAIGMIGIEIANLEIMLGELLGALLHIDRHFGRIVYLTPQTGMGRLKIIENVMRDTLVEGSEGRTHVKSLIERARAVLGKRNNYVHTSWGTSPDDPRKVVRQELPFLEGVKVSPVELKHLTDLIEDIRELTDDVMRTTEDFFRSWPPYTWQSKSDEPRPAVRNAELRPPTDDAPKRKRLPRSSQA